MDLQAYPIYNATATIGLADFLGGQGTHYRAKRVRNYRATRVVVTTGVLPSPSTSTLSSRLKKVNETPVILPCSASKMLGGPPVSMNLSAAAVYTSVSPW